MNHSYLKITALLLMPLLLPAISKAQSLKERVKDCFQAFAEDDNLSLKIDIKAWEVGKEQTDPIDQKTFTYVNDQDGFYMKAPNYEVIQTDQLTIRVNHQFEEILLIPGHADKKKEVFALPAWINHIDQFDDAFSIKFEKEGTVETFVIENEEQLLMSISMTGKRLKSITRYTPQKIRYKGEKINTVLKMDYSYQFAISHTQLNEIISIKSDKVSLKKAYENYTLLDHRDFDKISKK